MSTTSTNLEHHERIADARFRAQRIMGWFRWITGVVTAIVVMLIIVHATIRENSIAGCQRSSIRADADARNWSEASTVRRQGGDAVVADRYQRNVANIRSTIPMPSNWRGSVYERGRSRVDIQLGCEDAYPTLIPVVR